MRRRQFGTRVDGLPAARTGVYYVVSRAVAMVAATRADLPVPGPLRALADGTLGCTELHRFDPA
ncbi:hypothetical protein [Nocardia sp. NPDC058705]|uniref:hypothetical protein n=1 Tax=Nocardia sp. NPDC058705 TaxID=3346609 RepID=UPI0036BE4C15